MGWPFSGLLADAALKIIEAKALEALWSRLLIRCVDDTFTVLAKFKLDEFDTDINTLEPGDRIHKRRRMPFLDVLIMRRANGNVETIVYRKLTTTDRMLNYHSTSLKCHLRICVCALLHQASTHCSTTEAWKTKGRKLSNLLNANEYPTSFINSCTRGSKKVKEKNKKALSRPIHTGDTSVC